MKTSITTIMHTLKLKRTMLVLLSCVAFVFVFLPSPVAAQVAEGDGVYFYGINGDTTPYTKLYTNSTNTFSATSTTVASGTAGVSVIKASPKRNELVAGYVTGAGVLNIVCYNGTTWTNEWSVNVGGSSTTRRFDIGYESDTGDVMVLYSGNVATTNELRFQTKPGSTGCGSGNWSGATNLDPVRTTGTVQWVKIAEDRRATSTLMTAIWADSNSDLSAMVWSGTAWGNEHTAALETALEVITAAQDTESFDVAYESLSGDVMVVWGSGGTNGTNGAYYAVCTGGTSTCTWASVRTAMPTFLDDASHISIAADPLSDEIVFASIGNAGADLQRGLWSGTGWTNTANVDTSAQAPTAGRMFVATGWLNNSGRKRAVITYYDSTATNIGWYTASGTTWTAQTDVTPTTAFGTQTQYKIEMNPFNQSELMFIVSNGARQGFAKRLQLSSAGAFTWTEPDGGVLAGGLASTIYRSADFTYLRYIPPPVLSGVLYSDAGVTNAGAGKTISVRVGTSTPHTYSTTTATGGVWEFPTSIFTSATSGTPFILWLDGDGNDATTVVSGYASVSIEDVPLYYNHVIVSGATVNATVDYSAFATFDSDADDDILYDYFASGSLVSITANAGVDFLIHQGTFNAPPILGLNGDFQNNSTFNANNGFITFQGSGSNTIGGTLTGTSSLNSIEIQGEYTFSAANASTTGIIIQSLGILTAPSTGLTLTGTLVNDGGVFINNSGTLYAHTYLGGISQVAVDVSGEVPGTGSVNVNGIYVDGQYLYVSTDGNGTTCSQTPGSAIGCELQIYDLSTGLTFVAGRDIDGSPDGTENSAGAALLVRDDILYWGRAGVGTACAQTEGAAHGCELLVYEVSNPANPVFLSGIDHDGSKTGNSASNVFSSFSMSADGNYLYTTKYNDGTACSQAAGSARGCELQVFDVSSSTNVIYRAGRDADGSSTGTGFSTMYGSTIAGDYLYIARHGQSDVCTDTPGSAIGCELQIYDISSSTNPIYVAGMDANGLSNGDTGNEFYDVEVVGNTLYVANSAAQFDCSANFYSCELQVYNITDPTNPSYITGRDATGDLNTLASVPFTNVHASGDFLYAFTTGSSTACMQTIGGAAGCELQIYDISSTTNPVYVAGRDSSGSTNGTAAKMMNIGFITESFVFGAGSGNATECGFSNNSVGCEVIIFSKQPTVGGDFVEGNALNDVSVRGVGLLFSNQSAEVADLTINSGLVTAPTEAELIITGNYLNNGDFNANTGTVVLASFSGTASGTMTGASAFHNLVVRGGGEEVFTVAVDTSESYIYSLAVSGEYGLLFAGSGTGGIIYRCDLTTGCDASGDFTTAYDTPESSLRAMVIDEERGVLYVGAGANGIIYRCDLTTGCDASGDFTTAYDTTETTIRSMVIDYTNDVLYVGTESGGIIYRCDLVTDCATSGDFTTAYDTTQSEIRSLAITPGGILFAGSGSGGIIYRCDTTTGCATSGDFTTAYDTSENYIHALAVDTRNNVLYAGNGFDGSIFRCALSTGCDASGDFTTVATSTFTAANVHSLVADNNNGIIYAGTGASGNLYRCDTYTGCDADSDWYETHSIASTDIYSLAIDSRSGALYAGSYSDGRITRRTGGPVLTAIASTTNVFINTGKTLISSSTVLEVSGNFTNVGQFTEQGSLLSVRNDGGPLISYAAGRDSGGSADGTDGQTINAYATYGDYLYVGQTANATACSQTIGAAEGCELLVYDISSPHNPIFVKGIDSSASTSGTAASSVLAVTVHPSGYLIVGQSWNATACSQTPGSAVGCEIKIYDLINPANPLYLVGRDTSGSAAGTGGSGFDGTIEKFALSDDGLTLYVGKEGSATACSQTPGSASGCELMVFDISNISDPLYVAGRDGSGSDTGTIDQDTRSLVVSANYLFVGQTGSYTECAQVAGAAEGCELLVYDISSTTNPTFVAGRDENGSAAGTDGYFGFSEMVQYQNQYLFVGSGVDYVNCANGSAYGCEVLVFDIRNPESPSYVYGFNLDGAQIGGEFDRVRSLAIQDEFLFIGKTNFSSACLQSPGNQRGCEIQIYSIANPAEPAFVVGQDVSGGVEGTGAQAVWALLPLQNTLYTGHDFNYTACSQTPGSAVGCELQVYDLTITGRVSGNLTGASTLGDVSLYGAVTLVDTASTTDFSVAAGTTTAPLYLTVAGSYTNSGVVDFANTDEVFFAGAGAQSISGTLRDTSALPVVSFSGVGTKTFGSSASTSAFTVASGTTVVTTHPLEIRGDLENGGTFTTDDILEVYALTNIGTTTLGTYSLVEGNITSEGILTSGTGEVEINAYIGGILAGLDYNGSVLGTSTGNINDTVLVGDILYVAKSSSRSACTQTAGGALGCELMVFDVSDIENPVFLAARDVSGGSTGSTATNALFTLAISGNYLYLGLWGNATACSQTPGSAEGCELQVYDISSSTNPVYVAGRDVDGSTTGANSAYIYALAIDGNYLYVGSEAEGGTCGQTPGNAYDCGLKVFDISSSTNPVYVAGRDVDGSNGSGGATAYDPIYELVIADGYLYLAKDYNGTACSQTPGSAHGCELQVWDISSSTNPVFEAGRDINGSGSGSSSNFESFDGLYVRGNYLYAGHWGNSTACSQTPGSAEGCELQIYDVSDPTSPTFVAGRDTSGSIAGTAATGINTLTGVGDYLYVGNFSNATTCSQTPGSAEGCELQVYDISSSTNPNYVAGRDADGSTNGTDSVNITSIKVIGNTLLVAKESTGLDSSCESSFGNCELMIFNRAPRVVGDLTGSNDFYDVTVAGAGAHFLSPIETNDLTIQASSTLLASSTLFVAGDFTQNGTFTTNSAEASVWVQQYPAINSFSGFRSVTYGNGLFVAVTSFGGGPVVVSPDGVNWTEYSAADDNDQWNSVTYGNGLFVAVGAGGDDRVMTSPDGITWTAQSAAGNNDEWNAVTYSEDLDLFVAVGQGGSNDRVMTSPDGSTWTVRTDAGGADNWQSVTYGNGLFVAVAVFTGTRVMTSPDGENWTAQSGPGDFDNWREVTYGNGLFVAVADGRAMTSPDGITWTVHNAAGNNDSWNSVTYGNGLFVAVGYRADDVVMTSPDGVNWTARSAAEDNDDWESVTYGNGLFVAVGEQAAIMTSLESFPLSFIGSSAQTISGSLTGDNHLPSVILRNTGTKTFTNSASTTDFHVLSSAGEVTAPAVLSVFGNLSNEGVLVADESIYLSGKYENTATITAPTTFTFSGEKQRAVGNMTGANAFSNLVIAGTGRKSFLSNASTTNITINAGAEFETPSVFSVAGNYTNSGTSTSKGTNWTAFSDNLGANWRGITYGNGLFVAVGEGGDRVMTSPDGENWTSYTPAENDDGWQSVTYGNGLFVAVANGGDDRVMTSPDGVTWTARSAAENDDEWMSVTYGNGLFVAVANSGDDRVMTSPDGENWTTRSAAGNDDDWQSVTYGNGLFVAVAAYATDKVMTSPDGENWTARSAVGNNDLWNAITYGNGLFVAVGADGDRVMTSPDGENWTARSAAGNDDAWFAVTYGDGLFVAVGQTDLIMSSPDGINWTARTAAGGGADNLQGVAYGDGRFVAVAIFVGERVMVSNRTTTEFTGTAAQSISGNLSGAHSFGTLHVKNNSATTTFVSAVDADELLLTRPSTTVAFAAGATSTFHTVTITGTEGNEVRLRSTTPDTQFGFAITDTYSITYVDVKDSSGTSTTGVIQATGIDSGNNTNWSFGPGLTLQSAAPYHFYVGQATTTLGEVVIAEGDTPSITAVNDILLHIDTAVTDFRFNQGTASFSYGGSAASKVATGVFYEESGATVRLDVLENFAASDTLVINGVTVGGFTTATTATGYLELHTDDTTSGEPAALDTQPIRITGSLAVANHPEDQVENQFSFQNRDDATFYRFGLTGNNEDVTITDLVLTLSGVQNLDTSDLTDFRLYRDTDNDGVLDGGDLQIDGSGIFTINGQNGAVTFSDDFIATTSANYIITADTNTIPLGASAIFSLQTNGITSTGDISLYSPVILVSAETIQHIRGGGGAGGATSRAGGTTTPGAGTVSGGESGGGGEAGQEDDGENIAPDPDFYKPTSTGSPNNEWTNGTNALLSDGAYATAASGGLRQAFAGFNFNIPTGNTIQGIAVKLDASGSTAAGTIDISISWDGGSSFTTVKATPTLSGTDVVYTVGGNTDTWGRSWSPSEFSSENFRLRVTGNPSSNTLRLDALEVRVYHQTGGGGSGGGGGGGRS